MGMANARKNGGGNVREGKTNSVLAHASVSILLCKYVTDFVKMLNSSQTLKIIGMKSALLHLVISVCWHL